MQNENLAAGKESRVCMSSRQNRQTTVGPQEPPSGKFAREPSPVNDAGKRPAMQTFSAWRANNHVVRNFLRSKRASSHGGNAAGKLNGLRYAELAFAVAGKNYNAFAAACGDDQVFESAGSKSCQKP